MDFLTSRLLGAFRHGFTTRLGGHSAGPYESLNLSGTVGDEPRSVKANWDEVRRASGLSFARVRQVHGCRVHHATGPAESPAEEADVVVSARPGVAACVSVADCVPVLLADPRSGAVAAVHAGWRGTLARAAEQAVAALARAHGARPGDLLAAVGPSIGPCCYEVSADLAGRFREAFGPAAANPSPLQARVDLWLATTLVLRQAGLARERVEVLERCTSCEDGSFFSHRRDSGRTGRQIAFIAPDS